MTTCVRCNKECVEGVRVKRDGSVLILARHDDKSPSYSYYEWPSINAFVNRPYPNDAKRRIKK